MLASVVLIEFRQPLRTFLDRILGSADKTWGSLINYYCSQSQVKGRVSRWLSALFSLLVTLFTITALELKSDPYLQPVDRCRNGRTIVCQSLKLNRFISVVTPAINALPRQIAASLVRIIFTGRGIYGNCRLSAVKVGVSTLKFTEINWSHIIY
jgi:hypothetical protein